MTPTEQRFREIVQQEVDKTLRRLMLQKQMRELRRRLWDLEHPGEEKPCP